MHQLRRISLGDKRAGWGRKRVIKRKKVTEHSEMERHKQRYGEREKGGGTQERHKSSKKPADRQRTDDGLKEGRMKNK